jgi:hypothetical protein
MLAGKRSTQLEALAAEGRQLDLEDARCDAFDAAAGAAPADPEPQPSPQVRQQPSVCTPRGWGCLQSRERSANTACLPTCAYCPRVQSEALGGWAASGDGSSGCSDPFPKVGGIVGLPPMQMCEPLQSGGEGSCSGGHACMPARCQTLPSTVGGQGSRQSAGGTTPELLHCCPSTGLWRPHGAGLHGPHHRRCSRRSRPRRPEAAV